LVVLGGEVGLGEEQLHLFWLVYAAAVRFLVQLYGHFVTIAVEVFG
jgi:hypothetical protein